ncbi:hypothetical protein CsSME_00011419 [Camellia sinensis var. sinensis]
MLSPQDTYGLCLGIFYLFVSRQRFWKGLMCREQLAWAIH